MSRPVADAEEEFDVRVDRLLQTTCEVARSLVGTHQAAMALIVGGDWQRARKYFSLSDKYAAFKDFTPPARGVGLHALVVSKNEALRLTQDEVERHPAFCNYGEFADAHPPLRGLLAVPLVGEDGLNYGLLQVSDKTDGSDFDGVEEQRLQRLADLAERGLDALAKVRRLRLGETVPFRRLPRSEGFVEIEAP